MKHFILLVFYVFVTAIFISTSYGQEKIDSYDVRTLKGEITAINTDENTIISVQEIPDFPEMENPALKEMDFPILSDTKLLQGADPINVESLTPGQQLTVRYYTDNAGSVVTLSLVVDM